MSATVSHRRKLKGITISASPGVINDLGWPLIFCTAES
jgi:hypothetical protein